MTGVEVSAAGVDEGYSAGFGFGFELEFAGWADVLVVDKGVRASWAKVRSSCFGALELVGGEIFKEGFYLLSFLAADAGEFFSCSVGVFCDEGPAFDGQLGAVAVEDLRDGVAVGVVGFYGYVEDAEIREDEEGAFVDLHYRAAEELFEEAEGRAAGGDEADAFVGHQEGAEEG